jgi:hypothetical protein
MTSIYTTDDQTSTHFDSVTLEAGGEDMLRIAPEGFYIRGVKIPVDDTEALKVYNAFQQWLNWAVITQNNE